MLVKIRPYTREEAQHMCNGFITDASSRSTFSVNSKTIFGNQEQPTDPTTKKRSCDIFTNTGVISFDMYVPNYFLCGKKLELLNKIMPVEYLAKYSDAKCSVSNIIDCNVILNLDDETFRDINRLQLSSEIYDIERHLIGADALRYIMEQFDVEEEIYKELIEIGTKAMTSAYANTFQSRMVKAEKDALMITREVTPYHIISDYYIDVTRAVKVLKVNDKEDNANVMEEGGEFAKTFDSVIYSNLYERIYNERILYLLSLMRDNQSKESFINLIQNFAIVMPIGQRPDTELGVNLINNAYNKLVKSNNNLRVIRHQKNQTLNNVINSYKELLKAYKFVTVDYKALPSKNEDTSYRDIVSTLIGKNGKIRSSLQSVPVDNSGRTVVIVDPEMSIDTIGIPYTMLRELLDTHYVMSLPDKLSASEKLKKLKDFKSDVNFTKTKKWIDDFCKKIPAIIGRQPTLWRFGLQGFNILPVEGSAIKLAPLQVVAFNADFDGDQFYVNLPISEKAIREVYDICMNINNIFMARDGSCHIYPRQEIMYGLWTASTAKPTGEVVRRSDKLDSATIDFIQESLQEDLHSINDVVIVNGHKYSLGLLAVKTCAGVKYADCVIGNKSLKKAGKLSTTKSPARLTSDDDGAFTEDWSIKLLTNIYKSMDGSDLFVKTVNNYTRIGMRVAMTYPPDISITDLPNIDEDIKLFQAEIEQVQHLYNIGLETDIGYKTQYSRAYAKFKSRVEDSILKPGGSNYVGDDNGFLLMAKSKCKGNNSTMMQMFGLKGRVMKNSTEVFNSIITNSMAKGLTGLEHLLTAYGGRQGQVDKSIETAKPGYISRVMALADSSAVIRATDCMDDKGLYINYDKIRFYIVKANTDEAITMESVYSVFSDIVVGRYLIEKPDSPVTANDVSSLFKRFIAEINEEGVVTAKGGIHLRSPFTCKKPCCQKCYGIDLSTHNIVSLGKAVGFEASQSIGEPGTQLTMKNFQGGGVAGDGNLTSSFELMQKYLELTDLNSSVKTGSPIKTDVLVPMDVRIKEIYVGKNLKQIYMVNVENNKVINRNGPITMFAGIKNKEFVKKGEGIQQELGDLSPANVLECRGVDELAFYVTLKLYMIFNREVSVNFKHFETLVSAMMFYVAKRDVGPFKAGVQYNNIEYMRDKGYEMPENFHRNLVGVKMVPDVSKDCMRSILFEDLLDSMRKHVITSYTDEVKDPWVRLSLGLMPNVGSEVDLCEDEDYVV